MSLLTDELRSWIGREVNYTAPDPLSSSAFRYFALALGDDNPRWSAGEAPPTFICDSNQYLASDTALRSGGHVWPLPVPNTRVLRGGHEYEFTRPPGVGDRLSVTWRIEDIRERKSADGRDLLIVVSLATYCTVEGELLATNRETIMYQALQA